MAILDAGQGVFHIVPLDQTIDPFPRWAGVTQRVIGAQITRPVDSSLRAVVSLTNWNDLREPGGSQSQPLRRIPILGRVTVD